MTKPKESAEAYLTMKGLWNYATKITISREDLKKMLESYASKCVREACEGRNKEMIKNLTPVLEKLHSKQYKNASNHLGTIIYCLENPGVKPL